VNVPDELPEDLLRADGGVWLEARRACPPPDLLLARGSDVLDAEVRDALAAHLSACDPCRRFSADVEALGSEAPDEHSAARVLARLPQRARTKATRSRWLSMAAVLACLAVAAAIWRMRFDQETVPVTKTTLHRAVQAAQGATAVTGPVALWAIEPPALRLPASVLAPTRSADGGSAAQALFDALAGYRARRFAESIAPLEALAREHPASADVAFYLGATYLLAGRPDPAVAALERARAQAEAAGQDEVDWYLAAAEQRAGRVDGARRRLESLCGGRSEYRERACAARATLQ